jgi:hypothetical protein
MGMIHGPCSRFRITLAAVLLFAATAPGCQPDGAGSIIVGDSGRWRKPPLASSKKAPTKPARTKGQGSPPAYKSIKERVRELARQQ